MYIKRKLEDTILRYLNNREIIAVIGPRQAGKTTLLKNIQAGLRNSVFLDFEDIEVLELFDQDIKSFAKKYFQHKYIFIDEFQYARKGGKNLKYLYDTFPENKIIISGSSALDLTVKTVKYLAGRIFVFDLYQADFEEFLHFKGSPLLPLYKDLRIKIDLKNGQISVPDISATIHGEFSNLLKEFILYGGYPKVILADSGEEKELVLKNIYNTYFLKDIKDILGLADDYRLTKLIKALAVQVSQMVSYNELSKVSEYDNVTLKKYLNIIEKIYISSSLRPFFRNKKKEIVKNPKTYFYDNGLRNYIIHNFNHLSDRSDKGALYENFVFSQILKQGIEMNFWRTKAKAEVDFVLSLDAGKLLPLECKSRIKGDEKPKSLAAFMEEYGVDSALLAYEKAEKVKKDESMMYIPYWLV